ncbi:hypothetical protein AAG906_040475 [Vitis piasezkii]
MNPEPASLEETPTWAVSIFCLAFFVISGSIDAGLHRLTKFLKKRKRKALNRALGRIKIEMMILGFISLLLTISEEAPISKICVPQSMANSFLPCKDAPEMVGSDVSSDTEVSGSTSNTTTPPTHETTDDDSYCEAKGKVSLVSREGIAQLNIFISVLAVFHVLYCVLTMCLGIAKMRKWKAWEKETQTLEYQIANDPMRFRFTRQTSFGRRHLKFWSDYPLLIWPVCLVRQFTGPVLKADYFTLRNGFIMAHLAQGSNFNFQKFLSRAFDKDFEQVVGFSFWIWIYSILFIFFSAHGFYNYYWLPFIPLLIILVVGTKLGVVITRMCLASSNENDVIRGTFLVKPHDDLFWFGRPKWLLHLLQFVLFQNSFQLAFFAWTWYEYGLRSCFNRETEDIALRIAMGVVVQFLCGYVTLPLYALVTQMGSQMKREVFTERVAKGLRHWHSTARKNLSRDRSTSTRPSPRTSFSDGQTLYLPQHDHLHSSAATSSLASPEISEETVQPDTPPLPAETSFSTNPEITEVEVQPKIITRGSYDGEISFASTWKVQ